MALNIIYIYIYIVNKIDRNSHSISNIYFVFVVVYIIVLISSVVRVELTGKEEEVVETTE